MYQVIKRNWLRLQAKRDKSTWYNLTKEFAQNEKLTYLISQGGINHKSKDPIVGLSPCLSLSYKILNYALPTFLTTWLAYYYIFKGAFFNFKIIFKGEHVIFTILN